MATTSPLQMMKYGQSSILVHSDDIADGYVNGLLSDLDDESDSLTDTVLSEHLIKTVLDTSASPEWNAGYLLGMTHSLLLGKPDTTEPDAPMVQLGAVTLHLNNWRFREGFAVGQQDYQLRQRQRAATPQVTASDLLRFIAHHDAQTNCYSLGEQEMNALEDTLGRFTGFLCAALFEQEVDCISEQLHGLVLQEAGQEDCSLTSTMSHHPVTVLQEIDLGRHHLLLMSDQSLDLLRQEETPYVADNVLSLDACEAYRLLRSLQELFK